jgi:integrase
MKRQLQRLSSKAVAAQRRAGYFADGGGLYLQVTATRSKSWIFRYTLNGRSREMGLGSEQAITLAEARRKAAEGRRQLAEHIDPIDARDAQRAQTVLSKARSISFAQCAEKYIAAHRAGWRNPKHADQWTNTIETYSAPVIGALPVQDVDTGLVLKVLEPIWTTKPETASRLRSRIEAVLDWASSRGYRSGDNPARWRGHLDNLLPRLERRKRVKHHPALPYSKVGDFMQQLRTQEGMPARALEFAILTGCRTGELIGAKRAEFDLANALWTIPAARMKSHREHRVPLSPQALAIVREALKAGGEYVFPGRYPGKPMSNMAMLELVRRMGADLTVHGFRSTFRDWAAESTNYPREVCEMALAHVVSDKTEAAYRRGDLFEKRRRLMAEWARYCEAGKGSGRVIPLSKRQAGTEARS